MSASASVHIDEHSLISLPPVIAFHQASHCCPSSPQKTPKDQQEGLAQASMKSLLLPWVPVHRSGVSVSPSPVLLLDSSHTVFYYFFLFYFIFFSTLSFKTKCSGDSSSWCQTPSLRSLKWGTELSFLGRSSAMYLFSNLWVIHSYGMGFDYIAFVPLLQSCSFSFVSGCRISSSLFLSMLV